MMEKKIAKRKLNTNIDAKKLYSYVSKIKKSKKTSHHAQTQHHQKGPTSSKPTTSTTPAVPSKPKPIDQYILRPDDINETPSRRDLTNEPSKLNDSFPYDHYRPI